MAEAVPAFTPPTAQVQNKGAIPDISLSSPSKPPATSPWPELARVPISCTKSHDHTSLGQAGDLHQPL